MIQLPFLNRHQEIERIQRTLELEDHGLMVLYGRRRCGKSRLLQELKHPNLVYSLADKQTTALQIHAVASEVGRKVPQFAEVIYPGWAQLFASLNQQLSSTFCLVLDEFPYLVQNSPELPSIIQKQIDLPNNSIFFILCGSSQRMMQGLVLDATEPLYGRASEIIKLQPLAPQWIQSALEVNGISAIEAYSVWGGIPRYWELAKRYSTTKDAIKSLVFDRNGVLHQEPQRLLAEDTKGDIQAHSILATVGQGNQKLSRIASRLQRTASGLSRPILNLIELEYLRKEVPFGESPKLSRHTLYQLNDPFLQFWYRFIQKNQSLLQQGLLDVVFDEAMTHFHEYVSWVWEDLARQSVPFLSIPNGPWKPGQRWWGAGTHRKQMEVDVIAESFDGQSLLIGEAKWEESTQWEDVLQKLKEQSQYLPFFQHYSNITYAIWSKHPAPSKHKRCLNFCPEDVLKR